MKITYDVLKDKVLGCWNGKNIGGVLGAPLEGKRGVFDVDFYLQENLDGNPPPNDDLDLQLVWLAAAERYGQQLNAEILAEYWLTFITADFAEYGRGKANLRAGIQPGLSGHVDNTYRHSCGAFIRSEVWACLCPGNPALAVKFAHEDAIIDHSEEGVEGELFCAAMQSAAFVESDQDKLVEIGLNYIPEDSRVAKAVRLVQKCYRDGLDWKEARARLMQEVPGTFGAQHNLTPEEMQEYPHANGGDDCANNIGIMMIGWLYGEGDFGKSLCIAVNCGEDTDCTAGTLGALFGILHGNRNLPEKWTRPIGGVINTICIDLTHIWQIKGVPKTVDELSMRVLRAIPRFLDAQTCDVLAEGGYTVEAQKDMFCHDRDVRYYRGLCWAHDRSVLSHERFDPMTIRRDFHNFVLYLEHPEGIYLKPGEPLQLKLHAEALPICHPQWLNVRVHCPDSLEVRPCKQMGLPLQVTLTERGDTMPATFPIEFYTENPDFSYADVLIEVWIEGRHTWGTIRTRLYVKA